MIRKEELKSIASFAMQSIEFQIPIKKWFCSRAHTLFTSFSGKDIICKNGLFDDRKLTISFFDDG